VKQGFLFTPTLCCIYIYKLEEWVNNKGGVGVNIRGIIIKILMYANNLTLIIRKLCSLQDHHEALDSFCVDFGMVMNTGQTKIVRPLTKKDNKTTTIKFLK
jgi:hypothetical protein